MSAPEPIPFKAEWPEPDYRFLRVERPEPPVLPLDDVFSARWSSWVKTAAEAKASPPDFVMAAALSVCAATIGNNRWVSPWSGWAEPPILWAVAIGNPSMNKSPGLDAVLSPLKKVERTLMATVRMDMDEWQGKAEIAKVAEAAWKETVKKAVKDNEEPPARPNSADPGPQPVMPRLSVNDTTVEKLGVIVSVQPRGTLLARDELAGWLQGMSRYSGGGSDRPFWLEAYGGRGYAVERMGREPVYIDRLSIGVLGGIQPDRLQSLLIKTDDDGLLARFLPVWPNPAPVKRPSVLFDESFIENVVERLLSLKMPRDDDGSLRPWFVHFCEDARCTLEEFQKAVREWEKGTEGLLLSFIGKLPGLTVRLSLVFSMMEWASGEADEPTQITDATFRKAAHFAEEYLLPMARRTYADASMPKAERSARRLVALIIENDWSQFTTREVIRTGREGISSADDLNPALRVLEEADIVRPVVGPVAPQGGRPARLFTVNPAIYQVPHSRKSTYTPADKTDLTDKTPTAVLRDEKALVKAPAVFQGNMSAKEAIEAMVRKRRQEAENE
ncbi:YfjI family protein [Brucella anthropi]|uniref:DUF3987 domain-containing protein n=1 Tax=Brucella anthropi TaxID=529 RepID=A0A011TIR8_BRUAN|nr:MULTISPECIES: YfjI family protein [Brucella/Ochrobactrum group]EXL03877.1 hypothetical protein BG46_26325 [Brucella anthropi]KAB2734779.1 DUF3987 domain-containing protein [Brucella anthropi]KAB2756108.1 DUF3987 domain-containing protein [Brucella anthropi]KAB2769047.1 DUF3987 domain-containing protein [Brucella anthropi]MBE0562950.1 DUF3987 domain-containing protein [Brucella anthropi]